MITVHSLVESHIMRRQKTIQSTANLSRHYILFTPVTVQSQSIKYTKGIYPSDTM